MVMTSKGEEGGDWHIIVHNWRSGKGLNFFFFLFFLFYVCLLLANFSCSRGCLDKWPVTNT